jgi:hypothetical protein
MMLLSIYSGGLGRSSFLENGVGDEWKETLKVLYYPDVLRSADPDMSVNVWLDR